MAKLAAAQRLARSAPADRGESPQLAPPATTGVRASPIKAVALTNGDVDHVAGLLTLREAQPFSVYASRACSTCSARNRIFDMLSPDLVTRSELPLGGRVAN